jgi:hypothetical protein
MTWIKTTDPMQGDAELKAAAMAYMKLYPPEYAQSTAAHIPPEGRIGASHSLLPNVMFHSFAAFGAAMDPSLPLERRHHEMIATVVSVTNRCRY